MGHMAIAYGRERASATDRQRATSGAKRNEREGSVSDRTKYNETPTTYEQKIKKLKKIKKTLAKPPSTLLLYIPF